MPDFIAKFLQLTELKSLFFIVSIWAGLNLSINRYGLTQP